MVSEQSFSGAAVRLGYTQSAISGQVLALERVVGTRLIDRARPIRLTAEGEVLLRHARAISASLDGARAELRALRDGSGALRIGVHPAVSRTIVPETLRRLAAEDPDVDVELRELHSVDVLIDTLERGQVEIVLTALPVREGPFTALPIYRDEHVLVVRASDPLAAAGTVSLEELGELQLIAIDDCRAQSAAEAAMAADGWPLRVTRRLEDTASILAFVSAGLGVGFMPARAADLPHDLAAVPLPAAVPPRVIAAVRHTDREPTPRAERFVELAGSVARSLHERQDVLDRL